MSKIFRPRSFGMIILVLILAAAVYGFAAGITVPDTYAGEGTGTIGGYIASSINFTLNPASPSTITQVDFYLDAAADTAYVSFNNGSTWPGTCATTANGPGTDVSCTGLSEGVVGANSLTILASD